MSADAATDPMLDGVWRKLRLRVPAAHFAGAVLAATSGALTTASADLKGQPGWGIADSTAFVGYVLFTLALGLWTGRLICEPLTKWLHEDRQPTDSELRRLFRLPLYLAVHGVVGWLGAAAIWAVLTSYGHDAGFTVRVVLSILLGGLTTSGLVYLVTEWTMRPVVAVALADRVPRQRLAPGVQTKLMVSWLIGSDVFLLMIGLSFVGRPASRPPSALATWFIIGAGLLAGTAVVTVATRSLATPLRELRHSVGRVQHGDLEVRLSVDDGGEIGLLQAGFNEMVVGLRERAVLNDLFGRQVGTEVARQALAAGDIVLGGERREAAVIFVDLIGSTMLAQTSPPEEVVSLLNQFFATVVRVVGEEGGWVNKFEGDGALAIFGAPTAMDDCAARALRAARTLRSELLALAATNPSLDAAIGVSAGSVVAGNVGAEERYEYTVIGSPVNEAARITDEAKRRLGRVLASDEVVSRSGDEAKAWSVGAELTLRGYDDAVLVYEPRSAGERVVSSAG